MNRSLPGWPARKKIVLGTGLQPHTGPLKEQTHGCTLVQCTERDPYRTRFVTAPEIKSQKQCHSPRSGASTQTLPRKQNANTVAESIQGRLNRSLPSPKNNPRSRASTAHWPASRSAHTVARLCTARSGTLTEHAEPLPWAKRATVHGAGTTRLAPRKTQTRLRSPSNEGSTDHYPAGPPKKSF